MLACTLSVISEIFNITYCSVISVVLARVRTPVTVVQTLSIISISCRHWRLETVVFMGAISNQTIL